MSDSPCFKQINTIALCTAIDGLRGSHHGLEMAAAGITAAMRDGTADSTGVYFLLRAVCCQLKQAIDALEMMTAQQ